MTVLQTIFTVFLAAHVGGDFLLQSRRDVAQKLRPVVLLKHGTIHAGLTLVLAGSWSIWPAALGIAAFHLAIDVGKQRLSGGGWRAFLTDQALHAATLAVASWLFIQFAAYETSLWADLFGVTYFQLLALLSGLVVTVQAGAYFVDMAVEPFLAQIRAGRPDAAGDGPSLPFERTERAASTRLRGLRDGGRTIGRLERALIFIFVLIDQFGAIGFLIAAKSIFRFGELRERSNRMEAEYIIIGTLISFLWAITAAFLTRLLAGL